MIVITETFQVWLYESHVFKSKSFQYFHSLQVVSVKQTTSKTWECTEEGASLASEGSHEARLFASLGKEGRSLADIKANVPNSNIALGAAMKNKVRSNCVETCAILFYFCTSCKLVMQNC